MNRVFSNGPSKDFVINPFQGMVRRSSQLWIAAPFVTATDELAEAAMAGKLVYLLTGLNTATSPKALSRIHGLANCQIRYFTSRFHAKIYLFETEALLGSSNLTDSGLKLNREAMISLNSPDDVEELRALFNELWESALVLTAEKLKVFAQKHADLTRSKPDLDAWIEEAVGKSEPINVRVASAQKTTRGIFLETLRRQVHQYRLAFAEVTGVLQEHKLNRAELEDSGTSIETNRFLNWVRLTYAPGDEAWESTPLRAQSDRLAEVLRLGKEWAQTTETKITDEYLDWLKVVRNTFSTRDAIDSASLEELSNGLLSIHAFNEQLRFVKGGRPNLPTAFWEANSSDVSKVKQTLRYMVHGDGDFVERLHDVLYEPSRKLSYFGLFCALELYGTIKPQDYPPINGRIAKALRFLGYDVRGP